MVNMKKIFVQSMTVALLSLSSQVIANTLKAIDYQSLPGNGVLLTFEHAEQVSQPSSFVTTSPDSIVIDLPDTQNPYFKDKPGTILVLRSIDEIEIKNCETEVKKLIQLYR